MSTGSTSKNQLGDFRLIKKLGEGGMGTVYKARQLSMDRDVALKVLPKQMAKDSGYVERFYREARASAKLDHVNIVRGLVVNEEAGYHYFAMEFVDGDTCAALLEQHKRFAVGDAVKIVLDVASALEHAHSKGMVHRDVKPENIMITRGGVVKLADLGLAKEMDEQGSLTQTGSGFGTPFYMSPEQARNAKHADQRSDIYALGVTLYHFVTGKIPFHGETAIEVLTSKEEDTHTPARQINPEVPGVLDLIIDKMIATDAKSRFQSATEVIAQLAKTGLANDTLSFIGAGGPATRGAGAARGNLAQTQPAPAAPKATPDSDTYFIRYKDRRGQLVKTSADKHKIIDLIRRSVFGTDVEGSKDAKGPFRPLMAFPEFSDLMKARLIKEKTDQATGGMADKFAAFDKEDLHRTKVKKIKALVARVVKIVLVLAVLAGTACGGWFWYQKQQAKPSAGAGAVSPIQPPATQ